MTQLSLIIPLFGSPDEKVIPIFHKIR